MILIVSYRLIARSTATVNDTNQSPSLPRRKKSRCNWLFVMVLTQIPNTDVMTGAINSISFLSIPPTLLPPCGCKPKLDWKNWHHRRKCTWILNPCLSSSVTGETLITMISINHWLPQFILFSFTLFFINFFSNLLATQHVGCQFPTRYETRIPCIRGQCVLVTQLCPILCDPKDCSPPGSSGHGILQARILEWIATPFSGGSSRPRDWTRVSCIASKFFTIWATREAPVLCTKRIKYVYIDNMEKSLRLIKESSKTVKYNIIQFL